MKTRMLARSRAIAWALGCALLAAAPAGRAEEAPESCERVGESATEHTCVHASFGPFASVAAQEFPGFVYTDVNAPHTYFTITLPGDPRAHHGAVLYEPVATGPFAIYTSAPCPLAILDSSQAEVPLRLEHEITNCDDPDALTWVRVYELDETESYHLVIGPHPEATVALAVEYLPSFVESLYVDADGDGSGAEGQELASWCGAAEGYASAAGDCDDASGAVHPGAVELCNGADDDCSGAADDSAQICAGAAEGSACVQRVEGVSCGCTASEECPPGLACDAAAQICVEAGGGGDGGGGGGNGSGGGAGGAGEAPGASDGCGCRAAGGGLSGSGAAWLALAALIARRERRRPRCRGGLS